MLMYAKARRVKEISEAALQASRWKTSNGAAAAAGRTEGFARLLSGIVVMVVVIMIIIARKTKSKNNDKSNSKNMNDSKIRIIVVCNKNLSRNTTTHKKYLS